MRHLYTFAIGLVGALTFLWLKLPLPWLLGTLCACLIAAVGGVKLCVAKPLSDGMRTILGLAVGSAVSVDFIRSLPDLWQTLIIIPVMVIAIGLLGIWYFHRLCRYDVPTAYYASMPGGLQDMIVFGEEAGANPRALSLIHATRVLVILLIVPLLLSKIWSLDLYNIPGKPIADISLSQLIILMICGLAGWKLAARMKMFGATILGPLILAAIASLLGILQTRPPAEAIWTAQYFIALGIGIKYVGITVPEIRRDIAAGLGFSLILLVLTLIILGGIALLDLAPPLEALLSFAPGGQAELLVLAIIVGADTGFVAAHHLLRLFMVILFAPVMEKFTHSKQMH